MARKPAVQIICDRTGAAALVQVGVTLENMNEQAAQGGPALELTFRPTNGGGPVEVRFDDLCERSEEQVAALVEAISSSNYFLITETDETSEIPVSQEPAAAPATPEKPKSSRRTNVEIERDSLDSAVEAASSMVDKVRGDPEADELAVADARELLREALKLRAWFAAQTEKDLKKYVSAARKTRKAGGQVKRPTDLPDLAPEELQRYGFGAATADDDDDHGDHPDATTGDELPGPSDDDDDIFTNTESDDAQVDFL